MHNEIDIGPVPAEESCVNTGVCNNYEQLQREESKLFIEALTAEFAPIPHGAYFYSKLWPHDFGSYREVQVVYDEHDEEAVKFAFRVESELPGYWSEYKNAAEKMYALRHKEIMSRMKLCPHFVGQVNVPVLTEEERLFVMEMMVRCHNARYLL